VDLIHVDLHASVSEELRDGIDNEHTARANLAPRLPALIISSSMKNIVALLTSDSESFLSI
jgi:hypothetical protein